MRAVNSTEWASDFVSASEARGERWFGSDFFGFELGGCCFGGSGLEGSGLEDAAALPASVVGMGGVSS
jgi:hypothetical protein